MTHPTSGMAKLTGVIRVASLSVLILVAAAPVQAFHFEKVSEDTQRIVPEPQQGEPGGPQTSIGGDLQVDFANFQLSFSQVNDCSTSCDVSECAGNTSCTNLATGTFTIEPDPGETVGQPVSVCIAHSYDLSVTTTGNYTGYAAVGGVPTVIVDPTLVIRTPGGVEFSNGPVQITTGTQSDKFFRGFTAQIGDMIEARLGTEVKGSGSGIGSFRGVTIADLSVFSCPPAPVPALSKWTMVPLIFLLTGCGVLGLRRRRTRLTPS